MSKKYTSFKDVLDGLSNTSMAGEFKTDLGDLRITTIPAAATAIGSNLKSDPGYVPTTSPPWINPARPKYWNPATFTQAFTGTTQIPRGFRWADFPLIYNCFNTILPPNSELVLRASSDTTWGPAAPSSHHQGGCHVLMADGAVKFITDSIEAGNVHAATIFNGGGNEGGQSQFGLWSTLGSARGTETIKDF